MCMGLRSVVCNLTMARFTRVVLSLYVVLCTLFKHSTAQNRVGNPLIGQAFHPFQYPNVAEVFHRGFVNSVPYDGLVSGNQMGALRNSWGIAHGNAANPWQHDASVEAFVANYMKSVPNGDVPSENYVEPGGGTSYRRSDRPVGPVRANPWRNMDFEIPGYHGPPYGRDLKGPQVDSVARFSQRDRFRDDSSLGDFRHGLNRDLNGNPIGDDIMDSMNKLTHDDGRNDYHYYRSQ